MGKIRGHKYISKAIKSILGLPRTRSKGKIPDVNYPYLGLTYPKRLGGMDARKYWRKHRMCNKGMHLFDEAKSMEHYLVCDVCELHVHIKGFETSKQICARVRRDHGMGSFVPSERHAAIYWKDRKKVLAKG